MTTDDSDAGEGRQWAGLDRTLLIAGIAAPLVRLVGIVVLGAVTDGYSHIGDAISELGAVGSPTEVPHRAATATVGLLQAAFAAGLWRRGHRWLSVAIAVSAIGYVGSAAFAPSPGLPLPGDDGFETRDALHALFGVPTGVALVAAPLIGSRMGLGSRHRRWTAAAGALAIVLGATSLVLSGADTRGLWQRAFNVPAFAWQAYTATLLLAATTPHGSSSGRRSPSGRSPRQ